MQLSGFVYRYGRWISWLVMLVSISGVIYWGYGLTAPSKLTIATGKEGTYAYKFGEILKKQIEKNSDYKVVLKTTVGSADNRALLLSGEVDLAILRPGLVSMENLAAVSPLWVDYVSLVMQRNGNLKKMTDLKWKSVALGDEGTKSREMAVNVLKHYSIKLEELDDTNAGYSRLLRDDSYVGAIVLSNILEPRFQDLMRSSQFKLYPLQGAKGLAKHFPFFFASEIPAYSFATISHPLPLKSQETLATTSILATREDASFELVQSILPLLRRSSVFKESAVLLGRDWTKGKEWEKLPVHPAANRYFENYFGLEVLSNVIEKLNRFKEIIVFAVILLIALIFEFKKRKQHKIDVEFEEDNKKLESWLIEIIQVENEQKKAKDLRLLKQYHQDALLIKEKALKDVVGSQMQNSIFFQTFLDQCVHVIREIELKISGYQH